MDARHKLVRRYTVSDAARHDSGEATAMGGKLVRTIGIVRARMKIGMQTLTYNMSRLVFLRGMAASPP